MPTHLCQSPLYFNITLSIAQNLLYPESAVGMRNLTTFGILNLDVGCIGSNGVDVVSVPETSIYKHARPILPEYHIRLSRQARMIKPIAEAISPKKLPDDNLRLSVLAPDSRHIPASYFLGTIHMKLSPYSATFQTSASTVTKHLYVFAATIWAKSSFIFVIVWFHK
jgi:hypothetical protein